MAPKKASRAKRSTLPHGTRYGWDRTGQCVTFGLPVDDLPGWIVVLRFCGRAGVIELAAFEVSYFADRLSGVEPPDLSPRLDDLDDHSRDVVYDDFRDFVEAKALAPAPQGYPPGGLTIRRLRGIRVGDAQELARQYLAAPAVADTLPTSWAAEARRRTGMAGKDNLHFARIAQAYTESSAKNRIVALAQAHNVALSTMRNQIAEARDRGLLTRPGKGRAGGELKDKARDILRAAGELHGIS